VRYYIWFVNSPNIDSCRTCHTYWLTFKACVSLDERSFFNLDLAPTSTNSGRICSCTRERCRYWPWLSSYNVYSICHVTIPP